MSSKSTFSNSTANSYATALYELAKENSNLDKVEQYKSGKDKLFGFFVGQAMKDTQGKGNPKLINDILKEKLK